MDKKQIRDKSGQDNSSILLLERGKRGALNVVFGRTMLIVLLIIAQIMLLFLAFRQFSSYTPYLYGALMVFDGAVIINMVNKATNPAIKITWILLMVVVPPPMRSAPPDPGVVFPLISPPETDRAPSV